MERHSHQSCEGEDIATDRLTITFEGPDVDKRGVPVACFAAALDGVQEAMRIMVEYLGGRQPGPGRPPRWAVEQSALRLTATHPGSITAELVLSPPSGQPDLLSHGPEAIATLLNWNQGGESTLPIQVEDRLNGISSGLPEDLRLWLGMPKEPRRRELTRVRGAQPRDATTEEIEDAIFYGRLKEVNWHKGTAQLHQYAAGYLRLKFDEPLGETMLRFATQYVRVRGHGRFDSEGNCLSVQVEEISGTRSAFEPFDIEAFLNDPNPKVFDPEDVPRIDLTEEEWEAFNRAIRQGRDP